jgi:hypothetical protein
MATKRTTLEMRVLQRVRELIGNDRLMARELRVPMPDLFAFLKGDETPPKSVFLAAVDVLLEREDQAGLREIADMPPNQVPAANDAARGREASEGEG